MPTRRSVLKLFAASALGVAATAVGLEYLLPESSSPQQPYISSLSSTLLKSLSTTLSNPSQYSQLYSLKGRVCFDYNGNGKQDGDEPPVQNATVQIGVPLSFQLNPSQTKMNMVAQYPTDSSGDFHIDIPAGVYKLKIKPDRTAKSGNPQFGFMCTSNAEFKNIRDRYDLTIVGPGTFNIGLMEGFFTSPLPNSAKETRLPHYVDLDPRPNNIRDWKCGESTYDGHQGTDYFVPEGTGVYAAAPGTVSFSDIQSLGGNIVQISHSDNNNSMYGHLKSRVVTLSQSVKRGDFLGFSGQTGEGAGPYPHLHFQMNGDSSIGPYSPIDPYRDLCYASHLSGSYASPLSSWTVDNNPIRII